MTLSLKQLSDGQYNLLARCYMADERFARGQTPHYSVRRSYALTWPGQKVASKRLVTLNLVESGMGGDEIGLLDPGRQLALQIPTRMAQGHQLWRLRSDLWESWAGHQFTFCGDTECPGQPYDDRRNACPPHHELDLPERFCNGGNREHLDCRLRATLVVTLTADVGKKNPLQWFTCDDHAEGNHTEPILDWFRRHGLLAPKTDVSTQK